MEDYDNRPLLEAALYEMRPQAEPGFERSLRQQLLPKVADRKEKHTSSITIGWRRQWVAIALALFVVLFLLTPAGRALAQQILQLGIFTVTNQPSLAEHYISDPPDESEVYTRETMAVEPGAASQIAGFTVYYPTYVPVDYEPISNPPLTLTVDSRGEINSAEAMFQSKGGSEILYFSQQQIPAESNLDTIPLDVGQALVEQVQIDGYEGLWLANYNWGTTVDAEAQLQPVEYNLVIWIIPSQKGDNSYFWLGSQAKLEKEEMIRIAESASPR